MKNVRDRKDRSSEYREWISMFNPITGSPIRKKCWCGNIAAWNEGKKTICYQHITLPVRSDVR